MVFLTSTSKAYFMEFFWSLHVVRIWMRDGKGVRFLFIFKHKFEITFSHASLFAIKKKKFLI
jgi:hypothetical protein